MPRLPQKFARLFKMRPNGSCVRASHVVRPRTIADQLRKIVEAEGIDVYDESLQLVAPDSPGSKRDAPSQRAQDAETQLLMDKAVELQL